MSEYANTPARAMQIPSQLAELQDMIAQLEKEVENLCARLVVITRSDQPILEVNKLTTAPVLCEHAEMLANKTDQLRRIKDRIVSLSSRIEL